MKPLMPCILWCRMALCKFLWNQCLCFKVCSKIQMTILLKGEGNIVMLYQQKQSLWCLRLHSPVEDPSQESLSQIYLTDLAFEKCNLDKKDSVKRKKKYVNNYIQKINRILFTFNDNDLLPLNDYFFNPLQMSGA